MATNFFERQDRARRSTWWLVVGFLLAVVGIVVTTYFATVAGVAVWQGSNPDLESGELAALQHQLARLASGAALVLIVGGTILKVSQLRLGGGAVVAEQLGGRRLSPDSRDPQERRLLNVVEEMAIASGIPVPPVYWLDEPGINAFAAGYTPGDAVLGVTRGAVEQLSREELQGVMAHEFSHILNGDMRLGIRLIGVLHGILLLGLVGHFLFRIALYSGHGHSSRGNRRDGGGALLMMLAAGVVLVLLGFLGSLIGGIMKAAVSRQREYLADASAVQFTRNPQGIAGALKRIGAAHAGSRVEAASATQASHLFFAQGVWEGFSGLMATHPPLAERIRAIDPTWDGKYPPPLTKSEATRLHPAASGLVGERPGSADETVDPHLVEQAADQVGDPREIHRLYAHELLDAIPTDVLDAAREPFGARAIVYCLLFDPDPKVRQKQTAALLALADQPTAAAASHFQGKVAGLDPRARLPLLDVALPALRSLTKAQYRDFINGVNHLAAADENLSLFEWTLGRMLQRHLAPQFEGEQRQPISFYGLQKLGRECSMLLSTLAHVGHDREGAQRAFAQGEKLLPEVPLEWLPREACGLPQLREALDTLCRVTPKHRGRVVDACAEVICADGHVRLAEAELLRGIADLLDCPVPPFVAGQPLPDRVGGAA